MDIANVFNNYFIKLCKYYMYTWGPYDGLVTTPECVCLFHVRQTNSSRLLSCLSIKRINALIYYIYMLLTVVQLEHQFIPFKLWNAVFQFLPQYQNHSCAVKLNILILAENYKFLVTPDNSHIWISSYRLHRLSRSAQWKRLMWSVSFFRW